MIAQIVQCADRRSISAIVQQITQCISENRPHIFKVLRGFSLKEQMWTQALEWFVPPIVIPMALGLLLAALIVSQLGAQIQ